MATHAGTAATLTASNLKARRGVAAAGGIDGGKSSGLWHRRAVAILVGAGRPNDLVDHRRLCPRSPRPRRLAIIIDSKSQ